MNRSTTSPYKPSGGKSYMGSNSGNGQPLQLMVRTLQKQNNGLVQEINVLRSRTQKVGQLEDKIDLVLKHNTQLLNQNQRLAKLINQKKNQTQLWKNKYQTLSSNKNISNDLEIKRLLNQIEKLKQQICQIQHIKNLQINQLKNQNHLQIQNIKRTNLSSAQKYELEIRKLKQYCDKKQYQISQLNMKYVRLNKQTDFQIGKLRQQKQRFKNDLHYQQNQHKKEIQILKNKFDYNFHSQIQNLKKQHLNQIQALDYQNSKLKQVINSKNMQIEQIFNKNAKVKGNYQDSLCILQKQNDQLKQKIIQTQHIGQLQLNNLRQKLQGIKQSQILLLKTAHNNQIQLLTQQIRKLQKILDVRNAEIQTIVKQRSQMRIALEADILKAKGQLEFQQNENRAIKFRYQENLKDRNYQLKAINQQMKTMENFLKSQINTLKNQRDSINNLLESKQQELRGQRTSSSQLKSKLESQNNLLKQKLLTLKQQSQRDSKRSSTEFQQYKKINDLKIKQLQTKIKGLEDQKKQIQRLTISQKQTIKQLQKQIKKCQDKIQLLENCQKQLRRDARQSLSRWDAKQKQLNSLIKQQNLTMQRVKKRQIQQLKNIYENKILSLKHQLKQYQKQIDNKNKLLTQLKQKYSDLVNKFQQIFAQRTAQKNLDIKIPGWLPQTLSTKSLFDVFLKNKVLEYCS